MNALKLNSETESSNLMTWVKNLPFINYGKIVGIRDGITVDVSPMVHTGIAVSVTSVALLSFSSLLYENSVEPKIGDTVLYLSLKHFDKSMFISNAPVYSPNATGYNDYSCVGILLSTLKGWASTVIRHSEGGVDIAAQSALSALFNDNVSLMFCREFADEDDAKTISLLFGEGRSLLIQYLSEVNLKYGFWKNPDDSEKETAAPLSVSFSSSSPVTVTSKADVSLETEKQVSLKSGDEISIEAEKQISLKGANESLGAVLSDLIEIIGGLKALDTSPYPGMWGIDPATSANLNLLKTRCENMLKK